jgi:hypothetical protein
VGGKSSDMNKNKKNYFFKLKKIKIKNRKSKIIRADQVAEGHQPSAGARCMRPGGPHTACMVTFV